MLPFAKHKGNFFTKHTRIFQRVTPFHDFIPQEIIHIM